MKVNVVNKKLIKPCIPTPEKLRSYKISFTDEIVYSINVAAILFYSSTQAMKNANVLNKLEESLAQILPQFYPLAGRYVKQDRLVDCNDSGAEFSEAEADCALLEQIGCPMMESDSLYHLLPCENGAVDEITDPILSIQVTKFKCGGLAIGVSISHRIFDASSFATFIAAWANANSSDSEGKDMIINPSFDSISLFPGKNLVPLTPRESRTSVPSIVLKRFLFNKAAITSLRDKIKLKTSSVHAPSRVLVVCSVIAKALNVVDRVKHGGRSRGCVISQAVNIRGRMIPPLPKHSCGNLVALCFTTTSEACNIGHMEIHDYFNMLGDATKRTILDCAELLCRGGEGGKSILVDQVERMIETTIHGDLNLIYFSDWSKFGFYEVDFGWGKPIWCSAGDMSSENLVILMDNKEGDGIEACVHLHEKSMPYFEQDEDIKLFTI